MNFSSPESAPLRRVIDRGLCNLKFQDWMAQNGLAIRRPEEELQEFDQIIASTRLTRQQQRVISAYYPLGTLTTSLRAAEAVWGDSNSVDAHNAAVIFHRLLNRLETNAPDSQVVADLRDNKSGLKGFGVKTAIDPMELAVAFLIQETPFQKTYSDLATEILEPKKEELQHAIRNIRTVTSRMLTKIPDSTRVVKRYRNGLFYLQWQTQPQL